MPLMQIRDVTLNVEVVGHGPPLALMHGGPGADQWTLVQFRRLADRLTLVFYDHRCNGRSSGAPVTSMTWDNLTADADALREELGFEQWAVLGHSFGGNVALEYALRYPERLTRLILLDSGADSWWPRQNSPRVLLERGFSRRLAGLDWRFHNGRIRPREMAPALFRMGGAYNPYTTVLQQVRDLLAGEWHTKLQPEALIYAGNHLLNGWSVMDRLSEIKVPTLVIAGRDDFLYPPEHQQQLAAAIPDARLMIVGRAGHNPHSERRAEVMQAVADFVPTRVRGTTEAVPASTV
jgi:pimeloyl-ACP methyl ester carboxylesterase